MENKEVQIRLVLLSTDHEDMEGYEKALRTLFEENVVGIGHFDWGVKHPNPPINMGRDEGFEFNNRDKHSTVLHLRIPATLASTVSVFQEQLTNTTLRRDQFDQDKRKSFTLALYELIPAIDTEFTIGRIKVITNCFFPEIGIGRGHVPEPRVTLERERFHDQEEQWKVKPTKRSISEEALEGSIHFAIAGRELIANDKAREAAYNHAYADFSVTPKKKAVAKK